MLFTQSRSAMADDRAINSVAEGMALEIFGDNQHRPRRQRPPLTYREAARETPVFSETDVLVIGGGPSGTSAAVAAARLGADVTLVERYNHLGGLSTVSDVHVPFAKIWRDGLQRVGATDCKSVDQRVANL